jgi:phosphohistidine swiveling domain-containing protein
MILKNLVKMAKITWELCNTRKLSIQGAIGWDGGIGTEFQKRYGTGIFNTLTYFNGNTTNYFFDKEQHVAFNEHLDAQFSNREFVLSMISESKETLEEKYENIKRVLEGAEKLNNKGLAVLFMKAAFLHVDFYPRKWMAYRICHRIDLQLEKKLKLLGKTEAEIAEFLRILSVPLKPNYPIQEKMDLLKIVIKKDLITEEQLQEKLDQHTQKYKHIPLFDIDDTPFTVELFRTEFELLENPQEKLNEITRMFGDRQIQFQKMISKFESNRDLQDLLTMLKRAVFFRDYGDTIRQKMNYELRKLYVIIGGRIGLTIEEIVLLTNEEIERHLSKSTPFDKHEIHKRQQAFLLMPFGESKILLSGKDAKDEAEALGLVPEVKQTSVLKGLTASQGVVEGRARVVHTNKLLNTVQEGEIMVTGMTRQDFIPHMRKIQALVTEEGGIACHAAIIARELGLPCIVGTEVATKVIKDGDLIRVNGETGEVEILRS